MNRLASGRTVRIALILAAIMAAAAFLVSCASQRQRQAIAWTEIGNAWADAGKWDKAGDAWSRAKLLDPQQAVASYNLARALAEAGKYDETLLELKAPLAKDPDNTILLAAKAYALHKAVRHDEALAVYERILVLGGADSSAIYNYAILLESSGRLEEAMENFDAVLAVKPEDPSASYRKAMLLLRMKKAEEAIAFFGPYLKSKPDSVIALTALAHAQEELGNYTAALEAYTKAVAGNDKDAGLWFSIGSLHLLALENKDAGLEALNRAKNRGYSDKSKINALISELKPPLSGQVAEVFSEGAHKD